MTEEQIERIVAEVRDLILSHCPTRTVSPAEYVEVLKAVKSDCDDSIAAAAIE